VISLAPFTATQDPLDASCTDPFTFTYSLTTTETTASLSLPDPSIPSLTLNSHGQPLDLSFTLRGTLPSGEYTEQLVTVKLVRNMAAPYYEGADLSDMEVQVEREAKRVLPVPRDEDGDVVVVEVEGAPEIVGFDEASRTMRFYPLRKHAGNTY
jgi:hypothetical protein